MRKKYGSQMELPQSPDFEEIRQGIAMMEEQIESINKDVGLDMSTLRTAIKGNELGFFRIGWYAEGLTGSEEEPMSDLISKSALKRAFKAALLYGIFASDSSHEANQLNEGFKLIKEVLDDQPTIDAVPVVHARWAKAHGMMPPEYHHRKQCSMCGGWALQDYFGRERMSHYCPNCGAKMDGGAEG